MRRLNTFVPMVFTVLLVTAALLLHACDEDMAAPTGPPSFAPAKTEKTLTVTGTGVGSGRVVATATSTPEAPTLECHIIAGSLEDPTQCSATYPWRTTVELKAIPDLQGNTFAGWSGACTGTAMTCKVVMTQARSVRANFSGSGVPSYLLVVSGRGSGSGTVRSQAGLSPAINCTITLGTAVSGTCRASYPSGTSVTLTAGATNGTFDGWSGACSGTGSCALSITVNRSVRATFTAPLSPDAAVGRWAVATAMPIVGIHLSHLSTGKLLLWGRGGEPQTWDPADERFAEYTNNACSNSTTCELFCSGHTFLSDGRLLVAGGHYETATAGGNGFGLKQASIFDGNSWSATAPMSYARWYPTLVELENGDVVAISGSQDPALNASYPERYDGASWTTLTGAQLSVPIYPRAFLEPLNGWIYYAGEGAPRYLDPNGTGNWSSAPARAVPNRQYGSAVMLDAKVVYVGGGGQTCPALPQSTAEIVDLNAPTPTWSPVASMTFRRRQTNATILPDGTVLVTGGTSACGANDASGAVFAAENYNPVTDQWTTWATASVARMYHSTTALLPDGRVFSTGSGEGGGAASQYTYEVFSPPYLFRGARPTYTVASTAIRYGTPFTVQTPDGALITKVTIIRLASTTHAFDAGQRLNTLAFQVDGQALTITPPASGRIAPPGPYMLFILNDQGVPSMAQTVLLSH